MIGSKKAVVALADLLGQKTLSVERQPRVIAALGRFKDPRRSAAAGRSRARRPRCESAAVDALVAIVKDEKDGCARRGERAVARRCSTIRRPRFATARSPPRARSGIARRSPP